MPDEDDLSDKKRNLGRMSQKELVKLEADVKNALSTYAERNAAKAHRDVAPILKRYGITMEEIYRFDKSKSKKVAKKSKKPVKKNSSKRLEPKYRNPDDPTKTWSGFGRPPVWFSEARDAGIDVNTLLIS